MRRERVSLAPVVAQCLELHAPLAAQRGVRLDVSIGADVPELNVDVARIGQVLGNLVGNALRFTEAGGTIRIGAERAGPRVRVSVADTGKGIGPDDLRRLFDRLWQARRSDLKRGTGLGLAIAKGIVEAHGGTIRAESVEGSGSTFSFELPLP
jgi:signal transduction histidine kinase